MSIISLWTLLNKFKKEQDNEVTVTGRVKVNGKTYYFTDIKITNICKYEDTIELEIEDIKL